MHDRSDKHGTIFKIQRYSIHDGPGIRTTVFLKGCPLDCWWCHNPEGRRPEPETMCREIARADKPPLLQKNRIGRSVTVDDVITEVHKDLIFYDESGGGVTFSGGEPLMQVEFLDALITACRRRGIHTAVDTSGYAPRDTTAIIIDRVDLWLFDLKLMDDAAHRRYTGVSNRWILETLRALSPVGERVRIRFPIIPGITDTDENIDQTARYVQSLKTVRRIYLLPYHGTAEAKYHRLKRPFKLNGIFPPSRQRMAEIKHRIETYGLQVHVGG